MDCVTTKTVDPLKLKVLCRVASGMMQKRVVKVYLCGGLKKSYHFGGKAKAFLMFDPIDTLHRLVPGFLCQSTVIRWNRSYRTV